MKRGWILHCLATLTLIGFSSGPSAWSAGYDLTAIPRSIALEPSYQTDVPEYCLLVFGKQAKTRAWLVLDGQTMYFDRNANGDLTEPDEKLSCRGAFKLGTIQYGDSQQTLSGNLIRSDAGTGFRLRTDSQHIGRMQRDRPMFGKSPQSAPILHFDGPATFAQFGPISILPRNVAKHSYRHTNLRLYVGTPGVGENSFVSYDFRALRYRCNEYPVITAEVSFPVHQSTGNPIRLTQALKVKG